MICVARRVTAVERTERFSTRHELTGKIDYGDIELNVNLVSDITCEVFSLISSTVQGEKSS